MSYRLKVLSVNKLKATVHEYLPTLRFEIGPYGYMYLFGLNKLRNIFRIHSWLVFNMNKTISYMLSNEILRFLSEIEIDITTGGHYSE